MLITTPVQSVSAMTKVIPETSDDIHYEMKVNEETVGIETVLDDETLEDGNDDTNHSTLPPNDDEDSEHSPPSADDLESEPTPNDEEPSDDIVEEPDEKDEDTENEPEDDENKDDGEPSNSNENDNQNGNDEDKSDESQDPLEDFDPKKELDKHRTHLNKIHFIEKSIDNAVADQDIVGMQKSILLYLELPMEEDQFGVRHLELSIGISPEGFEQFDKDDKVILQHFLIDTYMDKLVNGDMTTKQLAPYINQLMLLEGVIEKVLENEPSTKLKNAHKQVLEVLDEVHPPQDDQLDYENGDFDLRPIEMENEENWDPEKPRRSEMVSSKRNADPTPSVFQTGTSTPSVITVDLSTIPTQEGLNYNWRNFKLDTSNYLLNIVNDDEIAEKEELGFKIVYTLNSNEDEPEYFETGIRIENGKYIDYDSAKDVLQVISHHIKGKTYDDDIRFLALIENTVITINNYGGYMLFEDFQELFSDLNVGVALHDGKELQEQSGSNVNSNEVEKVDKNNNFNIMLKETKPEKMSESNKK